MTLDRAALAVVVRIAPEDCGAERERRDCFECGGRDGDADHRADIGALARINNLSRCC
jgi:hypothetical protein